MTIRMFLNGRLHGTVQFLGGHVIISPDASPILDRLPVVLFPLLDPGHAQRVLAGLTTRDIVIPGYGLLHVEVS